MRVLVTGANGFIGKCFFQGLENGWYVVPLIRQEKYRFDKKCRVFDGSAESLVGAMDGVDVVLHLATHYIPQHGSSDVPNLIDANITFGTILLEAMGVAGVSRIVNIGTTWQKYNAEDYRYANLYAATKQAFQEIVSWYCDAKGFSAINLHLSDTYGEGDTRKKVVQLLVEVALSGDSLDMSEGLQKLELTHIDDVVRALTRSCELVCELSEFECHTYSLLTGCEVSLRQLANLVSNVVGRDHNINWGGREYRDREVMVPPKNAYVQLPGWSPQVSLDSGLRMVWKNWK